MKKQSSSLITNGESDATRESGGDDHDLCFISMIPAALLLDILCRLPVQTIMRCKCVCTDWKKQLSEPSFSDLYAQNSRFMRVVCFYPAPNWMKRPYLLEISADNGDSTLTLIDMNLTDGVNDGSRYNPIGYSNGFICSEYGASTVSLRVYNPVMGGRFIELPAYDTERLASKGYHMMATCYFGYNPVGNNYKVLRAEFTANDNSNYYFEECEIITVGVDDRWRSLPIQIPDPDLTLRMIDFNGVFNWIPRTESPQAISTFNLADETLGQLQGPPNIDLNIILMHLRIVNNKFSLVHYPEGVAWRVINVWTMNNYGVAESWTRSVIRLSWAPDELMGSRFTPVLEQDDGEILFRSTDKSLVSFHPNVKNVYKFHTRTVSPPMIRSKWQFVPNFHQGVEDLMED